MTSFHIRSAIADDAGAVRQLLWMLWDHHHNLAPQRVLTADAIMEAGPEPLGPHDREEIGLIAERDGEILGYARLIVRDQPPSRAYPARSVLVVPAISVRPQARRRGVGRALIERARALGREHGVAAVQIPVLGFNTEALAFYRSLGFEDEFLLIGRPP